jgi:hypothetical protein
MELIMNHIKKLMFLSLSLLLFSCEDVIEVSVDQKQVKLVVDAFINNLDTTQTIRLTRSIPYFQKSGTEPTVTDATVVIADTSNLKVFPFTHTQDGLYTWNPNKSTGDTFVVGRSYALFIIQGGDTLISITKLNPTVTAIDSIITVPTEGNGPPNAGPGKYIELRANDLPGKGNFYWIKTYRNDTFSGATRNLNISQDMGNTSNGQDGELFIYPIRFNSINDFSRPFLDGEKVRIEIHSISLEAFYWFNLIVNESNNGGLFSTPPVNIQTNIFSFNPNKKIGIAGLFSMSDVRYKELIVKE